MAVYELSLELDRTADTEDDPDVIVKKMNETVEARKEKLDALTRLEAEIEEMRASAQNNGANERENGDLEREKNTVEAVLRNLEQLDAKIFDKLRRIQDALGGELQLARNSQKCFASYVPHEEAAAQGTRFDARK